MDLTPYVESLREDLLAAASIGDEDTRRAAALLATALTPAARLVMMNALSDLAAEVTGSLEGITVDLRLDGPDLRVSVSSQDEHGASDWSTHDWDEAPSASEAFAASDDRTAADDGEPADDSVDDDLGRAVRDAGDELSRTTLRLVNKLKAQAERAASAQGVSLNTYIQRAVSDAVRSTSRRTRWQGPGPHSMRGFVQG